jgi:YesN/AraC family two-component response regulator
MYKTIIIEDNALSREALKDIISITFLNYNIIQVFTI